MTFNLPVLILADKALAHVSLWQKRRAPVEILLKPLPVYVSEQTTGSGDPNYSHPAPRNRAPRWFCHAPFAMEENLRGK